ncbi:MAG TPA: 6-phosphofructokinase [Candidatus Woesearchaeota archaeon]|jgi:6-phosphofructokinase|nr:6-phosphofructokinase [Candidatus Woesearchaeota archaeon]HJN56965.1 6-phosphofructokinase [Candidatus Woesearchaeota archaeon]|tara:strand:- start:9366 stop:10760 length:1395 start_codon:yes stop_codon:yes gene_type:complete
MGGGGTTVVNASAYSLIKKTITDYRDKIGAFYAAVGGLRGAINEDITDVFKYAESNGKADIQSRLNKIKFPASPVFRTSRVKPENGLDCERLLDVFKAHNIQHIFMNGGNDTMEKLIILQEFFKNNGYELHIIGIPKTIDNDLLVTDRCPGYASFAKQVAINTMSLQADMKAFSIPTYGTKHSRKKETAPSQVVVYSGRDGGWGVAASIMAKVDESAAPHVILTKEGGFSSSKFLDKCQNAFDKYGNLFVVSAEGAHDGKQFIANYLNVSSSEFDLVFKMHKDPHKNTNMTNSRLGLFLKLLIEKELKIDSNVYKYLKTREEGPAFLDRNHLEIMSVNDFYDAVAVGEKAADLAFGESIPIDNVMVTLAKNIGETGYTKLENVADIIKGSKAMTKSFSSLNRTGSNILTDDGMMIDRGLYLDYIGDIIDLNGPNRSEFLRNEDFKLPLKEIKWTLEKKLLDEYR